jgi:hypothetical protein
MKKNDNPNKKSSLSHKRLILNVLLNGWSITQKDAYDWFECFRLSGRIYDLKKEGYNIDRRTIEDPVSGKKYASYFLPDWEEARKNITETEK